MLSAAYFRRQADICVRLSLITSDEAVSTRLLAMAKEYMATSETLESGTPAPPSPDQDKPTESPAIAAPLRVAPEESNPGTGPAGLC
jgi:hypothetical protein